MWNLYGWKSVVEIIFFSYLFHSIMTWLSAHKRSNLLGYFLGYCTVFILSYLLHCQTIVSFLVLYCPVIALLFIVMHERTLQKNFITIKRTHATTKNNWPSIVIRASLYAINSNKTIAFVIEGADALEHLLSTPFTINGRLSYELLTTLIAHDDYDPQKAIWISTNEILCGINTTWTYPLSDHAIDSDREYIDNLTRESDTLVLIGCHKKRLFTLYQRGTRIENLKSDYVLAHIQKTMTKQQNRKKGAYHAPYKNRQKDSQQTP